MMEPPKSEQIRGFIIKHVEQNPVTIAKICAEEFGISRQSISRHIRLLVEDEILEVEGAGRTRHYRLKETTWSTTLELADHQDEDKVYRTYIEPRLTGLSQNVVKICSYGFSEMFNNCIDHSEGSKVELVVMRTFKTTLIAIKDNGIGIFDKLKKALGLSDSIDVILELVKGKLTTDPTRHSGQGIFFTSRMFDRFQIVANSYVFGHVEATEDWVITQLPIQILGTKITLVIENDTLRSPREVFDKFSDLESGDYEFSKTHVPLKLANYGADGLISRSAAKRVLSRVDAFKSLLLDFTGVESIGHSFADEIFRVYANNHPEIEIHYVSANEEVLKEIKRAKKNGS